MAQYNLTDNTQDSFTFKIGELEYSFRYPTTIELREIGVLNDELQKLVEEQEADSKAEEKSGKDYEALVKAKSAESEAKMDALVTPIGHDNNIGDVLETQPINVIRNFRSMMKTEISLG
jgi:hypothetical protein